LVQIRSRSGGGRQCGPLGQGEVQGIGERANSLEVGVRFDPALQVADRAHAQPSLLGQRFLAERCRDAVVPQKFRERWGC
jgi:hypothetical protein